MQARFWGIVLGILGFLGTVGFSIWAVNDARKQVRKSVELQRNLAWLRVQNDIVWEFVNPTEKAISREIAKGMDELTLLSIELESAQHS